MKPKHMADYQNMPKRVLRQMLQCSNNISKTDMVMMMEEFDSDGDEEIAKSGVVGR
ncbi:MAG: hypothetical protein GF315_09795 [candidate division Zixibacteria bacterium]|nr:hypothetical protein [candidate division Zixibacteria bacterium]